jgi:exosortase
VSRDIVRELALAALIAAVIAAGPLTPNELAPSLLIGGLAGAAWLIFRLRGQRPGLGASEAAGADDRVTLGTATAAVRSWLPWLGLVAVWCLAFWPTLEWLWQQWTASVWVNDHGLFMPPLIVYLGWTILRDDPVSEPDSSSAGFWLVAAGLSLSVADAAAGTRYLGMVGLLVSLPGVTLLFLGRRRTRLLAVPLVLSLLMTPIPVTLSTHLYLRHATAAVVEPMIRAIGLPVFREDTVMHLSSGTFVVADACSGFSTLYASLAVAIVLVFLVKSPTRRLSILVLAPVLAVLANIVRVASLILIAHFVGDWTLDTPLHEATGVASFLVVLTALLAVGRTPAELEPSV